MAVNSFSYLQKYNFNHFPILSTVIPLYLDIWNERVMLSGRQDTFNLCFLLVTKFSTILIWRGLEICIDVSWIKEIQLAVV